MKALFLTKISEKHIEKIIAAGCEVTVAEKPTLEEVADAEIVIGWCNGDVNEALIDHGKELKWMHILSAGIELLPFEKAKERGILVSNSRGIHGIPIGEHVFAMILSMTRNLGVLRDYQRAKKWDKVPAQEIYGKTMAVIGLGSIGLQIATLAKAFGMKVIGTKRTAEEIPGVDMVYKSKDMKEALAEADFVVVAVPHTKDTEMLFGKEEFEAMKESAFFVNIARGKVADENALIEALKEGKIAGACLDVFETEPLGQESPLWKMENVLITPHQAALSPMYMERALGIFLSNIEKYKSGEKLNNAIDLDRKY